MVQGPSPEVIQSLRHSTSREAQILTLKQLKNDIVGHEQRKELVVKNGLAEALTDILTSTAATPAGGQWSEVDEARLQATLILGSLASGG